MPVSQRRAPDQDGGPGPEHPLGVASQCTTEDDQPGRRQVVRDDPQDRRDLRDRRPLHIHRAVQEHDREVGEPERESVALVRIGDRERADQEAAHAADQRDPVSQTIRRDRVRQPRVSVVHPPDEEEHHDDLHGCSRVAARDEHARQLRDREDEDEVEEELERRDAGTAIDELGHNVIFPQSSAGACVRRTTPILRAHAAAKRTPSGIFARPELRASGVPALRTTQRREKVMLTVAVVFCSPGTIGVDESA